MDNVIIYSRVSTYSQDTRRQESELERLCLKESFNVIKKISETVSGKVSWKERELSLVLSPELKIDGIVVWELSRLGRNTKDVLEIIEELNKKNIWVYSKKENIKTLDEKGKESPTSKLLLTVLSGIADLERDTIIERNTSGLKKSVEDGRWTGGKYLPYGYRKENKRLVIDEEESKVIELIFDSYLKGLGTVKIANKLNQMGILTRYNKVAESVDFKGLKKEGKDFSWVDGTVYSILTNPTYIGEKTGRNTLSEMRLNSPAIIKKDIFEEVQQKLKSTKRTKSKKYFYVLDGKLKCGVCGLTYYPHKRENNKDNTYKCLSGRYQKKCENNGINIPKLNGSIWTILRTNDGELENIINLNHHKREFQSEIILLKDKKNIISNEIAQLKRKEQRLLDLYLNESISNDLIKQNLNGISNQIDKYSKEAEKIENEIMELKILIQKQHRATISLRSIKEDKHILKKTFDKVIDRIVINPIENITHNNVFVNKQDKVLLVQVYTYLNINKPLEYLISQRTNSLMFKDEHIKYVKENREIVIPSSINYDGDEEEYSPKFREIIRLDSLNP